MRKNLVAGFFAAGLIIAGSTGVYITYAKENGNQKGMMQQGMDTNQMVRMMNSKGMQEMMNSMDTKALSANDWKEMQQLMHSKNYSFDQMLPFMKKMHPNLSNEQLKGLYDKMHGKDGAASCSNLLQKNAGEKE